MFLITLQTYLNAEFDKTEMLMNLKKHNAINGNGMFSRNIDEKKKKQTEKISFSLKYIIN